MHGTSSPTESKRNAIKIFFFFFIFSEDLRENDRSSSSNNKTNQFIPIKKIEKKRRRKTWNVEKNKRETTFSRGAGRCRSAEATFCFLPANQVFRSEFESAAPGHAFLRRSQISIVNQQTKPKEETRGKERNENTNSTATFSMLLHRSIFLSWAQSSFKSDSTQSDRIFKLPPTDWRMMKLNSFRNHDARLDGRDPPLKSTGWIRHEVWEIGPIKAEMESIWMKYDRWRP